MTLSSLTLGFLPLEFIPLMFDDVFNFFDYEDFNLHILVLDYWLYFRYDPSTDIYEMDFFVVPDLNFFYNLKTHIVVSWNCSFNSCIWDTI